MRRSEEEVDLIISELLIKTKGNYITQGVSFNKNKQSHMKLLKMALMESDSFSGLIKEMLTEKFSLNGNFIMDNLKTNESTTIKTVPDNLKHNEQISQEDENTFKEIQTVEKIERKNTGNFVVRF